MIIRSARLDDAFRIASIHVRAWQVAYRGIVPDEFLDALSVEQRHTRWQQNLEAGDSLTWVAEDCDIALGWISAARSRDIDAVPSTGEIWGIYVDPGHWRKGVGRALCAAAEQELRNQRFTALTLWVLKNNQRAIEFYVANGFAVDACKDRMIERGGKALLEMRMAKQLSPNCVRHSATR